MRKAAGDAAHGLADSSQGSRLEGHFFPIAEDILQDDLDLARPEEGLAGNIRLQEVDGALDRLIRIQGTVQHLVVALGLDPVALGINEPQPSVGEALVKAAIARAAERGCYRIELDTGETNENARRLYAKCGFSESSKGTGGKDLFLGRRTAEPD